jgi:hypothetical protein
MYTDSEYSYLESLKELLVLQHKECDGTGYIDGLDCICSIVFRWLRELRNSRIPVNYWGIECAPDSKESVESYFADLGNVLSGVGYYFCGDFGTGKTTSLCAVGKRFISSGKSVLYFMLKEYMEEVYRSFNGDTGSLVDKIEQADVLLIDEFHAPYIKSGSDFVLKEVEGFLRKVLSNNKPVFVGSNPDMDDIRRIFGNQSLEVAMRRKIEQIKLYETVDPGEPMKMVDLLSNGHVLKYAKQFNKVFLSQYE